MPSLLITSPLRLIDKRAPLWPVNFYDFSKLYGKVGVLIISWLDLSFNWKKKYNLNWDLNSKSWIKDFFSLIKKHHKTTFFIKLFPCRKLLLYYPWTSLFFRVSICEWRRHFGGWWWHWTGAKIRFKKVSLTKGNLELDEENLLQLSKRLKVIFSWLKKHPKLNLYTLPNNFNNYTCKLPTFTH